MALTVEVFATISLPIIQSVLSVCRKEFLQQEMEGYQKPREESENGSQGSSLLITGSLRGASCPDDRPPPAAADTSESNVKQPHEEETFYPWLNSELVFVMH